MLVERMVKKSAETDTDLPNLQKALTTISGVADHVNLSLKRRQEQLKLLELQSCFFPPIVLVQPGRRLLRRAELGKIAEKNNSVQKYTFFLFNDALAYGAKLFGGYYRFHRMLTVTGIDPMPSTDHSTNRFKVMAMERNVTLGAPSYDVSTHIVPKKKKKKREVVCSEKFQQRDKCFIRSFVSFPLHCMNDMASILLLLHLQVKMVWVKAIQETLQDHEGGKETCERGRASTGARSADGTVAAAGPRQSAHSAFAWQHMRETDESPERDNTAVRTIKLTRTGTTTVF